MEPPHDIRGLCAQYSPRLLDGQVLTHTTALQLHGAPVPRCADGVIHVSVLFPRTPPRAAGAVGHSLRRLEPVLRDGLPTSSVEAAWCESASVLTREDLVAAGDALVTGRRRRGIREAGATDLDRLVAAVASRPRMRGGDDARWALRRIRSGVDSPAETRLRLLLMRARLPEPDVDVPVEAGRRVLHSDLGYPDARVLLEYEGDVHRIDRDQWMHDIRRREAFEDAGFRLVRVVAADLHDPSDLIARVGRLLAHR